MHVSQIGWKLPRHRQWRISPNTAIFGLRVLDFVAIAAIGIGAFAIYVGGILGFWYAWSTYVLVALIGALIANDIWFGWYRWPEHDITKQLTAVRPVLTRWFVVALGFFAAIFLLEATDKFSRAWALFWFIGTSVYIVSSRLIAKSVVERLAESGMLGVACAVLARSELSQELADCLHLLRNHGLYISGVYTSPDTAASSAGKHATPGIDALTLAVRSGRVQQVIISAEGLNKQELDDVLLRLSALPVPLQICPDLGQFPASSGRLTVVGEVPLFTVRDKPLSDGALVVKRIEDVLIATTTLTILSPLMLLIALLIKLDSSGPVIFKQTRYGYAGEKIDILKFRTMTSGSSRNDGQLPALRNDPRVTMVGRFLRRTSLDELPQLTNVLQGQMSIVGPRPHAANSRTAEGTLYHHIVGRHYFARQRVKPGLTGLAQINCGRGTARNNADIRKRLEQDVKYIETWSLWLDVRIIILTAFRLLTKRNEY